MRQPAVSGQFYMGNEEQLKAQLKDCFQSQNGPGALPTKRSENKLNALIVPHAGYQFSGGCAAWAYKEIAESHLPKTYLLIGPNHFGVGSGLSIEDWKTPLGVVKTDKDLVMELKNKTQLKITEENHVTEHSLEVQLPFLQYVTKDNSKFKVAPLVIGRDLDFAGLANELYEVLKNKDVVVIISSDFTHYGTHYGYLPFSSDVPERITKLDQGAIKLIMNLDTNGFKDYVNKTGITICGFMPILLYLALIDNYEDKPKAHLLMHYTSGDITKNYHNSVSYASIIFK